MTENAPYDPRSFEEIEVADAGKRCGVRHAPWMGDWFVSWSPRNDNSNAEGPWDHWVDLALLILRDPLTKIVRPEAHMPDAPVVGFYSEAGRLLAEQELSNRFGTPPSDRPERDA